MKSNRWFSLSDVRIAIAGALFIFGAAVALMALSTTSIHAQNSKPTPAKPLKFNGVIGPLTESADAPINQGTYKNPPSPICTTSTSLAPNVNTDCEDAGPSNETSIAINPTNSLNRIGGANDYQLVLTSGGYVTETILSRAHVTFAFSRGPMSPLMVARRGQLILFHLTDTRLPAIRL